MDEQVLSIAMVYGPRVLVAIILLAAGYFAGQWAGRASARGLGRYELEPPVLRLVENIVRVAVFALFAIMALQNIGVELLPLIAGLSVVGAAVALATQGVLGNMVAGLTIIFSKPYRVGDFITIAGVTGEVLEIALASTTVGHADLSRVVIPNRKIVGDILHNYGRVRQLAIEVTVPYEADVEQALDTARAVLRANPRVLKDHAPVVGVARFVANGVTLLVAPWVSVADYGPAGGEINQAILAAFTNRNLLRTAAVVAAA